jgi:ubiquinone/menaquinone biosynthesis C-methylase UbiE
MKIQDDDHEAVLNRLKQILPLHQHSTFEGRSLPELMFLAGREELLAFCGNRWNGHVILEYHMADIERGERGLSQVIDSGFELRSGMKLFDAGCGYGGLMVAGAQRGLEVFGMDINPDLVSGAAARLNAWSMVGHPQVGDLLRLPFRDAEFDLVTCQDVFDHLPAWQRALREFWRVLKPGGALWLTTATRFVCYRSDPHYQLWGVSMLPKPLAAWYLTYVRRRLSSPADYGACTFPTNHGLFRLLRRQGFRVIDGENEWLQKVRDPSRIVHNERARRVIKGLKGIGLGPVLEGMISIRAEFTDWFSVVAVKHAG